MELPEQIVAIGALADPIRRALYEFIASSTDPMSREAAADAVGITLHQAKFHLERLVEEGLLVTEQRRLSGKSGPGAGRPAKLYRRSPTDFRISLPERRHDLAGEILASAIERSADAQDLAEAVDRAAHEAGVESLGGIASRAGAGSDTADELSTTAAALERIGYEPELSNATVRLRNCPFEPLSRAHTELICSMNHSYVRGVLDGLGCAGLRADLEPHDTYCCVAVRPAGSAPAPDDGGAR